MSNKDLIVPNIGDFKDVEVIEVLINEGDNIKKNDPLITIESDKSSVEIPSIYSGKIEKLNLKVGDKVSEGSSIATISAKDEIVENIKEDKKLENKKETSQNADGDKQKPLDIFADECVFESINNSSVAAYCSEEQDGMTTIDKNGKYLIFCDPLDLSLIHI